ncbi:MAG: hypothetical protein QM772_12340 [Ottowia sp.]|uniref:hypothetical protein n=1 Tax=Ottowia sp. TaxID=1898956 RepID=UPI0039E2E04B
MRTTSNHPHLDHGMASMAARMSRWCAALIVAVPGAGAARQLVVGDCLMAFALPYRRVGVPALCFCFDSCQRLTGGR